MTGPELPATSSTTRRRALKAGAAATAAGALVWTAPVVLSSPVGAGPAVPSGLTLGGNVIVDPSFDLA